MRTDNGFMVLLAWLLFMALCFEALGSFMNEADLRFAAGIIFGGAVLTFFVALTSIWKQQHPEDEKEEE